MAVLDTDYASEAYTCESSDDGSQEGDAPNDMATRRKKAGLGVMAKMVVGPVWRNPDVSTSQEANTFDNTHLFMSVHRLRSMAHLSIPHGKAARRQIGSDRGISQEEAASNDCRCLERV